MTGYLTATYTGHDDAAECANRRRPGGSLFPPERCTHEGGCTSPRPRSRGVS